MNVNDDRVRELYREMRRTKKAAGCLDEPQLVRAISGELASTERLQVMDHLGACSRCVEEYRALEALKPWAHQAARLLEPDARSRTGAALPARWLGYASAAAAVVVSFWIGLQLGPGRSERSAGGVAERQLADVRAQLRDVTKRAEQQDLAIVELRRSAEATPHVNVPIVDLEPADALRGPSEAPRSIELAAGATLVTFVLTPSRQLPAGSYGVELRDRQDQLAWKASGLRASADNTCTLAVPRALLPPGESRVRLFLEGAGRPEPVEGWVVRIVYR
jgi:hypothetical protein